MCTLVAIFCAFPITKNCAVVLTTYTGHPIGKDCEKRHRATH